MRAFRITALFLAVALVWPSAALAAGPTTQPATIRTETFDATLASDWLLGYANPGIYTPVAYWGAITNSRRGSVGKGLWVAGSQPTWWPTYHAQTAGKAQLTLDQLQNYYSSQLDLYYTMPSLGMADSNSFSVAWEASGPSQRQVDFVYALTPAGTWLSLHKDLSATTEQGWSLSRTKGKVLFQFFDWAESGAQPVKTGQGPTVDDVKVSGYWFGPVRDLTATTVGATVELAWQAPYKSPGSTLAEDRAVAYRVWRAPQTTGVWQEITTGRLSATSMTDTPPAGASYVYAVQAWEPGTGTGYGQHAEATAYVPAEGTLDISAAASKTKVLGGEAVTFTYTTRNNTFSTITGITVTDTLGTNHTIASLAPGATDTFTTGAHSLNLNTTVVAHAVAGAVDVSSLVSVQVYHPSISLRVTPASPLTNAGKWVPVTYTVKNTGDYTVSGVKVSQGATILHTVPLLQPQAESSFVVNQRVTSPLTVSAIAAGKYGQLGESFYGNLPQTASASAAIGVMPTRISGNSRMLTTVEVSKRAFPNGADKAIVVASAYGWADALPASSLAGAVRGPLLLVGKDSVPDYVLAEMKRMKDRGATTAYVVGGASAVGTGARNAIRSLGLSLVAVQGTNRYETAYQVSEWTRRLRSSGPIGGTVFVATGLDFPDALAASSIAAAVRGPILLTPPTSLAPAVTRALANIRPTRVVVCGGTNAVSDAVKAAIQRSVGTAQVVRQAGNGRYDTAKAIVTYGKTITGVTAPKGIFLATGTNYPDALAGGVLAGIGTGAWTPLMLTAPATLSVQSVALIKANPSLAFATVLGGTTAVSGGVESAAVELTTLTR